MHPRMRISLCLCCKTSLKPNFILTVLGPLKMGPKSYNFLCVKKVCKKKYFQDIQFWCPIFIANRFEDYIFTGFFLGATYSECPDSGRNTFKMFLYNWESRISPSEHYGMFVPKYSRIFWPTLSWELIFNSFGTPEQFSDTGWRYQNMQSLILK